jgi:thiol:disulfide interchange protein
MQIKKIIRLGVLPALAAMTLGAGSARAADIKWHSSLSAAQAEAKKTKRPVLVYFSTTWCGPCKEMKRTTFKDAKVVAESRRWTMVQIDAEKQEKIAAKYKVDGYPTMILLKPNGATVSRAEGGMSAGGFLNWMKSKYAAAKK